mmetsp:Transcript_13156/g.50345  ORF Transcript_13156/g.50345 Transcript_13156/m.50345 type:complete len:215 (+) Transcript_13156:1120-1764(+)
MRIATRGMPLRGTSHLPATSDDGSEAPSPPPSYPGLGTHRKLAAAMSWSAWRHDGRLGARSAPAISSNVQPSWMRCAVQSSSNVESAMGTCSSSGTTNTGADAGSAASTAATQSKRRSATWVLRPGLSGRGPQGTTHTSSTPRPMQPSAASMRCARVMGSKLPPSTATRRLPEAAAVPAPCAIASRTTPSETRQEEGQLGGAQWRWAGVRGEAP